jgi:hypothetical protein
MIVTEKRIEKPEIEFYNVSVGEVFIPSGAVEPHMKADEEEWNAIRLTDGELCNIDLEDSVEVFKVELVIYK